MNVLIKSIVGRDGYAREKMYVGGFYRLSVDPLCECPEDAIIGRGLLSCGDLVRHMREAHDAGKRGEEFVVEYTKGSIDDEW